MRTNQTKSLLAALVTAALFIFNAKTHAASTALSNFMEATVGIFPNELTGSIREEVIYDDNIYRAPKGDERGGWILSTGLTAKWFRTTNRLTYGLEGEIIYDYYLKEGDELSQFVYSLSPVLVGNIGLGTGDLYVNAYSKGEYERLNNVDQRYARSYTNGVQAVWNLLGHERWGLAITGDWAYKYYPDKEFENNTKQTYGASIVPFCQVTGKTRLGLRLGYDKTKYKNNERHDDSEGVFLNAFVDYRMTQKFSVYTEAGVEKRTYEGETKGTNGDDRFTPNGRLALRYTPANNVILGLSLGHSLADSFAGDARGMVRETNAAFTAVWVVNPKFLIRQTLEYTLQDEKESVLDTVQYAYELRTEYYLTERFTVYGEYRYELVHYFYAHDLDYDVNIFMLGVSWFL